MLAQKVNKANRVFVTTVLNQDLDVVHHFVVLKMNQYWGLVLGIQTNAGKDKKM
jgi:hypothetical protein